MGWLTRSLGHIIMQFVKLGQCCRCHDVWPIYYRSVNLGSDGWLLSNSSVCWLSKIRFITQFSHFQGTFLIFHALLGIIMEAFEEDSFDWSIKPQSNIDCISPQQKKFASKKGVILLWKMNAMLYCTVSFRGSWINQDKQKWKQSLFWGMLLTN